jgi:DUF971 family protein
MAVVVPLSFKVRKLSRVVEIVFDDGAEFSLPFELLRVYSPSAEVRGHAPGDEILQTGKRLVEVTAMEPVGNYGIKPIFSDGHGSGIYTWEYLYELGPVATRRGRFPARDRQRYTDGRTSGRLRSSPLMFISG